MSAGSSSRLRRRGSGSRSGTSGWYEGPATASTTIGPGRPSRRRPDRRRRASTWCPRADLRRRGQRLGQAGRARVAITPTGRRKDELGNDDVVVVTIGRDGRGARSPSGLGPSSISPSTSRCTRRARRRRRDGPRPPAGVDGADAGRRDPGPGRPAGDRAAHPATAVRAVRRDGKRRAGGRIALALTEGPEPLATAALLERHGAVAVGPDPETAVDRLELVEVLCRTWRDSLLVQAARRTLDPTGSGPSGAGPTG